MFDAEAAWADLAEQIAERDGWGSERLLARMRQLETRHRLQEGLFQRFLRVYGGRFTVVFSQGEAGPSGAGRAAPVGSADGAPVTEGPQEDRDERRAAEPVGTG